MLDSKKKACLIGLLIGVLLAGSGLGTWRLARADPPAAQQGKDREKILLSDRWRRMQQSFAEWLSVQKVYTAAEVAQLKAGLAAQIASMSARELEDFMVDTEERLAVLLSDQANEARRFLDVLNKRARRRLVAGEGKVPNVFEMSASQLRRELQKFQQERVAHRRAYAQESRAREERVARSARLMTEEQQARETSRREFRESAIRDRELAAQRASEEATRRGRAFSQYAPLNYERQWYISPWGVFYY